MSTAEAADTDQQVEMDDDQQLPAPRPDNPVERARTVRALFTLPAKEVLLHEVYASCKLNTVYVAGRYG